jgi:hypothetical protein
LWASGEKTKIGKQEQTMKKEFGFSVRGLLLWAGTIVLTAAATAHVTRVSSGATTGTAQVGSVQNVGNGAEQAVALGDNAAYRDGLFQGKLARVRGSEPHVAVGRWSTDADRSAFTTAYQQAYTEPVSVQR